MAVSSWYSPSFKRRLAVTIDATSAGSGPGNEDLRVVIDPSFDLFWENIRSDGKDIILTDRTSQKVNFQRATFNYSLKSLTLEGQNLPIEKGKINVCWVYFDFADQVVDETTAFSPSSPLTGHVHLGAPGGFVVGQRQLKSVTESPIETFYKDPEEKISVWFSLAGILQRRKTESRGSLLMDDLSYVEVESLDSSGTNDTGRFLYSETRIIQGWVMVKAMAGNDGSNYALRVKAKTIDGLIFVLSCQINTVKLLPSAV